LHHKERINLKDSREKEEREEEEEKRDVFLSP